MINPLGKETLPLVPDSTPTQTPCPQPASVWPASLPFPFVQAPALPSARIVPQMPDLATKACVPCRGGVPPLKGEELASLQKQVGGWNVIEEHHIAKAFKFPDFREALKFVNRVGEFAEEQGHHPDIFPSLGKSRDYDLDAQNQRPDGERFCPGRQNRPALQTLVFSSQRHKLPRRRPPRSVCFDLADFRVAAARFAPKNFFDSP